MTDDATIVLLFVPALQNLEKFFFPAGALVKFGGEPAVQAASIIGFFFFWKRYGMSLFSPLRTATEISLKITLGILTFTTTLPVLYIISLLKIHF